MIGDKKIVVIGGGTGTFSVLTGLKQYTDNISAIVSMADSGGSAKKERDEWGLLPSSDIRKSLIALSSGTSQDNLLLRKLFEYRYSEGKGLSGMTFGNLFLVALTKLLGSQEKAIKKAAKILQIKGSVLPVTLTKVDLVAQYEDGSKIVGEHFIDEPRHDGKLHISKLSTQPRAKISTQAKRAIAESEVIIIGPGGFYTTILANLVIDGVVEAILKSRSKKIFILNLMTEYGQTYGYSAKTFIDELDKYIPASSIDYVIINKAPIPQPVLKRYKTVHAEPVRNNLPKGSPFKIVSADLLSPKLVKRQKGDKLKRSLVRHDPEKLAKVCVKILAKD